jgi:hypothetical protein
VIGSPAALVHAVAQLVAIDPGFVVPATIHTSSGITLRFLAPLVALLLIPTSAWPWAGEQRCQELDATPGAVCDCSETLDTAILNTDELGTDPGNSTPAPGSGAGPDDNLCGHSSGQFGWTFNSSNLEAVDEAEMPAGNTVGKVWKTTSLAELLIGKGFGGDFDAELADFSEMKRICFRYYTMWDTTYLNNGQNAGKVMEMTFAFSPFFQVQYGTNGYGGGQQLSCLATWNGLAGFCERSGTLDADDLLGAWVRVEMCVSGDFGGETGDFTFQGYYLALDDGERLDLSYYLGPITTDFAPELWGEFWMIVNGDRDLSCSPEPCNPEGHRYFSHLMQAHWNTSAPGKFIGPAYEIEGRPPWVPPWPTLPALSTRLIPLMAIAIGVIGVISATAGR